MTRKKRDVDLANFVCKCCSATIDYGTFIALHGLCNECFQQQHFGGKYCQSTASKPS
jgi:hypothetical protein